MTPYNSALFIVFAILATMMIIDRNVADYLTLVFKMININIQRFLWMMKYHPNNFVTTWIQNRKYSKLAKELHEELTKTNS